MAVLDPRQLNRKPARVGHRGPGSIGLSDDSGMYGPRGGGRGAAPGGGNGLRMPRTMATADAPARTMLPEPQRERAPTVGEGQQLPGVSGRMAELTESDSPYIQRARQRGVRHAGRRGLRSSSIAAGAAEGAAIDAALPIAQADASIAAGERGRISTELMQSRDHRVQQLMQARGLDHDAAQRLADRELSKFLQEREHYVQRFMQERDLEVRQLMQQRGFDHESAIQAADQNFQLKVRGVDQEFQAQQAGLAREFQAEQAGLGRTFQAQQAALDRETQRLMQERGLSFEEAQNEAQRTFAGEQAALDRETQRLMQERGLTFEEAQNEAQRGLAREQAALDRESRLLMQERGLTAEQAMEEARRVFAGQQAELDREARRLMQQEGMSHEEAMTRAGREQDQRLALDSAVRQINGDYQRWVTALQLNTEIPSEVRDAMMTQYANIRDQSLDALNRIHNTDIEWESLRAPPQAQDDEGEG